MASIRTRLVRRGGPSPTSLIRVAIATSIVVLVSAPAMAFSPESAATPNRSASPTEPPVGAKIMRAAEDAEEKPVTLIERISRRLRKIPLRPILIGETQRTPYDPEPGAGVTIHLKF